MQQSPQYLLNLPKDIFDVNLYYLIPSFTISIILFLVLCIYWLRYKNNCSSILKVISLLLLNQLIQSIFKSIGYMGSISDTVCEISLIGKVCFTIAANFWIIFITRVLYIEKLQPGKYFNIVSFYGKNIILTYTPSIIVGAFLYIIITINQSQNQDTCWRIIRQKQILDYVVYITCFILPNLIAIIAVITYLSKYFKKAHGKCNIFLLFPIVQTIFNLYYIGLKMKMFLIEQNRNDELQIPLILEPFIYMCCFIYLIKTNIKKLKFVSDITLQKDSIDGGSFINDFQKIEQENQ